MQKFNKLKSIPAYLPIVNIDTDMIIPKQFLKTIKKTGLGKDLFFEMRYDDQGNEIKDFILNQKPFNESKILIAGKNFGCGSSREHAPWALEDYGFRAIIAPSFADIFYNNCFKNGLLPITLNSDIVDILFEFQGEIEINLEKQSVKADNKTYHFDVDSERKRRLINGLDDIDLTLQYEDEIRSFEAQHLNKYPWL